MWKVITYIFHNRVLDIIVWFESTALRTLLHHSSIYLSIDRVQWIVYYMGTFIPE